MNYRPPKAYNKASEKDFSGKVCCHNLATTTTTVPTATATNMCRSHDNRKKLTNSKNIADSPTNATRQYSL